VSRKRAAYIKKRLTSRLTLDLRNLKSIFSDEKTNKIAAINCIGHCDRGVATILVTENEGYLVDLA
jgi:predicted metal-binding protein